MSWHRPSARPHPPYMPPAGVSGVTAGRSRSRTASARFATSRLPVRAIMPAGGAITTPVARMSSSSCDDIHAQARWERFTPAQQQTLLDRAHRHTRDRQAETRVTDSRRMRRWCAAEDDAIRDPAAPPDHDLAVELGRTLYAIRGRRAWVSPLRARCGTDLTNEFKPHRLRQSFRSCRRIRAGCSNSGIRRRW